jgi:3-deoxy-D-manno-octulosonate 8-phosphate phosphatase (KDO 8-P phosphatase)
MVYQKAFNKLVAYQKIKTKTGLSDHEIAYVGDDIVDLPVLRRVGLAMAVKDAEENVKGTVHYVTKQRGGRGAVREVVELLLRAQGRWEKMLKKYYE